MSLPAALRTRSIIWCCTLACSVVSGALQLRAEGDAAQTVAPANVLLGHAPISRPGVSRAATLSDGKIVRDGDFWKTRLSAGFED